MVNKSRVVLTILVLSIALAANAACESVVRDLPDTPVGPGEEITVRLTQEGFLGNTVKVTEDLPPGFEYVGGSYTGSEIPTYSNGELVMYPKDEVTVTYNVTTGSVAQIQSAWFIGEYLGFVLQEPIPLLKSGYVGGEALLTSDTTAPAIDSVELNETTVTAGDSILVTVDATDDTGVVSVTAEGVALTPLGSNIWEGVVIAVTGTDVVVNVCVTDGAGNTGWNNSTSYTATTADTTDPIVNSVTLNRTVVTVGDPILVTVDATDNFGVTSVTAEGVALTLMGDNIWEGIIIAVTGNDVVVNVCARDAAGNTGWNNSTSYTTTIADTTDPIVNSVTLNRTEVTDGDPILVTVNATDNFGVTSVTAEGVALTQLGSSNIWEGIIIAVTGNDVVVNVCAMDGAGNTGWNNSTSYTARWIREDVYPDGWITITDIVRVGDHIGETGEPGWIPEDVYPDGWITITDIVRVGDHIGETKP
jgi:hypothetical protein